MNVGVPPIVGSLFSWKSLLTNRRTSEDYDGAVSVERIMDGNARRIGGTLPTAASPSRTSLTLLLGLGAFESAMLLWISVC